MTATDCRDASAEQAACDRAAAPRTSPSTGGVAAAETCRYCHKHPAEWKGLCGFCEDMLEDQR